MKRHGRRRGIMVGWLVGAAWSLSIVGASAVDRAGMERVAPVPADVHGWPGYVLSNPFVRVGVVPSIGGRVMDFRIGDKQFLWVNAGLAGKPPPEGGVGPENAWLNYGGGKLWPAPQGWDSPEQWPGPPDAVLDGQPHTCEVEGSMLRLTSRPDDRSGIQFVRTIALDRDAARVRFEATMRNVDTKPRRWGIWEHTQLDAADADGTPNARLKSYCPLNPRSHFRRGYHVVFGAGDNPAWQADARSGLFTAAYRYRVGKAALDSVAGWVATVDGACGKVFVQRFVYTPERDYPDGATVEFWHNGSGSFMAWGKENVMDDDPKRNPCVAESELISPFFDLEPGAAATWSYEWCAADIGGDFAVVDCTSAAAVVHPLRVVAADGGKVRLTGHWGVFEAGRARGAWVGVDGRRIAEFELGAVSPAAAFVLDVAMESPAGAVSLVVELVNRQGATAGDLGRAAVGDDDVRAETRDDSPSVPCVDIPGVEPETGKLWPAEDDEIFILSFFRDNGQHGVYLAWSEDGLNFKPLNNDQPVMKPAPWPGQNLTRDPSIVYHDGKFRMVWTSNWGGRCFGVAESPDLKEWSEPRRVTPFPESLPDDKQPQNVWAPEICWNPIEKKYFIFWSSTLPGRDGHRIYMTTSADLESFSDAALFIDPGYNSIDGMMTLDPQGSMSEKDWRWVMVLKDERETAQGGKNIRLTTAPADLSEPWATPGPPIIGPHSAVRPHEMAEGPSLLKWKDTWYLYWDAFANGHYSVAASKDLRTWTDRTDELKMPPNHPRHGTVFRVPRRAVAEALY